MYFGPDTLSRGGSTGTLGRGRGHRLRKRIAETSGLRKPRWSMPEPPKKSNMIASRARVKCVGQVFAYFWVQVWFMQVFGAPYLGVKLLLSGFYLGSV